jgi:hypothetical protein
MEFSKRFFVRIDQATISDLADFLNINSPNGYKNFEDELFSEMVFFAFSTEFWNFDFFAFFEKVTFYLHLWNMKEVLVSWREKWKKIIADFHVLGLFMAKKHDLSEK